MKRFDEIPSRVVLSWIEQLQKDYLHIAWAYKLSLVKPGIVIKELGQKWAVWDSLSRVIFFDFKLFSYRWDIVIEVLKHEMAHQLITDVYKAYDTGSHDDIFNAACKKLGVADWASKACVDIRFDESTRRPLNTFEFEENSIVRKIKKLLALSQSQNINEAALAMQHARELMERHQIDKIQLDKNISRLGSFLVYEGKKRISSIQNRIFSILNTSYSVQCIYTNLYDPEKLAQFKAVEILGSPENVAIAEYVYTFLNRTLENLWKDFSKNQITKSRVSKKSYQLGLLHGFSLKLKKQPTTPSEFKALELVQDELSALVRTKYPRLLKQNARSQSIHKNDFTHGVKHGQSIHIREGVQKSGGRLFIEASPLGGR